MKKQKTKQKVNEIKELEKNLVIKKINFVQKKSTIKEEV